MIKIINIGYLVLSFSFMQCVAQSEDENKVSEPIDAIAPAVPFLLERDDVYLTIPNDLKEADVSGLVGLSVYFDKSENLQGFKIMKLNVKEADESIVNYVNGSNSRTPMNIDAYPKEVQKYFSAIEKYVNNLKYTRDDKVSLSEVNELTFIARLN